MFKCSDAEALALNPFKAIGRQWMLITAGNNEKVNTMTASWGGLGVMWNKACATCYVRPQRYTREFLDREEFFSLSFLPEAMRPSLSLCGRESGRDCDKIAKAGLATLFDESAPYFEQAELVLVCRKLYVGKIEPSSFIDPDIESCYPQKDYHLVYMGEVVKCLEKA